MLAVSNGQEALVHDLLEARSDVNAATEWGGWTALTFAACGGHTEIARILLGARADANCQGDGERGAPLRFATQYNHPDVAEILRVACNAERSHLASTVITQLAQQIAFKVP